MTGGRPFHVTGSECVVTRRAGRLVAFCDGELRASAPLMLISEVILAGRITVTTAAMHALLAHDIPLILLTEDGRALGRLELPGSPHVLTRARQLDQHRDPRVRVELSRQIIAGKLHNQGILLRRRARRADDPDAVWSAAQRLAQIEESVDDAHGVAELLGLEGAGAGAYFAGIRSILGAGHGFEVRERRRPDVVNMLINYCSAVLRETVFSALLCAGLDPFVSFLHAPRRGRPTLAFDMMEEWRPVLLESTVLTLLGRRSATADGLEDTPDGPRLSAQLRASAVRRLQASLNSPARGWPPPPGAPSYGDLVRRQALRLRARVLDDHAGYEPFRWR